MEQSVLDEGAGSADVAVVFPESLAVAVVELSNCLISRAGLLVEKYESGGFARQKDVGRHGRQRDKGVIKSFYMSLLSQEKAVCAAAWWPN